MPQIPLGTRTNKRRTAWMPEVRAVNMLIEQTDTNPYGGVDHIQRPGLTLFANVGPGPIRGVYRQAGTFVNDFLVSSGEELYRVNGAGVATFLEPMPGTDRTIAAATNVRAIVVSAGIGYRTTGISVVPVTMPDGRLIGSVAQLNGYFILPEKDSARFYWIEPGQTNPDGLSFATTESYPGDIIRVERVGDELWFFKEEGVEVWQPTGDADLPFQRTPGRNYDKGCRARDAVCRFDNSVVWIGNDGVVYRGDNAPIRISDSSIEEQIRKSTAASLRAWTFAVDGHRLLCMTMTTGTYVYDISSQQWSEFQSYGRTAWRAHVGDEGETFTVAGDDELGVLYRIDPQSSNDNGAPIIRKVTGGVPVIGKAMRCDSLSLFVTTGTATDPNLFPKVRVRWSDDLETYGDWVDVSIGRTGQYNIPVRVNRLGVMRYPGRLIDFEFSADVVTTVHGAAYNEPSR